MTELKIKIDSGYASFVDEQENNTFLKRAYADNTEWFATVTNYVSEKEFKYNFFDWSDGDMELNMVNVGDVIVANHKRKKSFKYSYVYRGFYHIIAIDDEYLHLVEYKSIPQGIKAQRKSKFIQV
jgi:hypothetical protein